MLYQFECRRKELESYLTSISFFQHLYSSIGGSHHVMNARNCCK
uniref:Uncharacterized protein n=1 Tax=Rhizophora mucronata TaxID=61149 RepID=A0A2P2NZ67_RHIMU